MEIITTILLLCLMVLPSYYLLISYKKRQAIAKYIDLLPGPASYPLVGTLLPLLFLKKNDLFQAQRKRVAQFKPLFRTWSGNNPAVHLMKPEHLELVMNNSVQINKGNLYRFLVPWLGEGLLTSTGSKWHRNRKLITPTFHFQILENFMEVFAEKGELLADQLRAKADGKVFDVYPFITRCALDIICETAMGVPVNAMTNASNEYVSTVYNISHLTQQRNLKPWLHPDFVFNLTPLGRQFQNYLSILHGFTTKVIKERKATLQTQKLGELSEDELLMGKKKRLAFLDLLLAASDNGAVLNDAEIRQEVDTFMFEGHDTTTAGICWSLFLLGNHPEVQEKVAEELHEIFQGRDGPITMKDLGEMKYLERVIKEALRIFPSVPFIGRRLSENLECDGYVIPKDCTVVLHIYDAHRDEKEFPDPERFDPDRFLPERTKNRHPFAYVPFSAGPRNCIGQKFAMLEEKTILAAIVRKYKIRSAEKQSDVKLASELILRPQEGIKLSLEPRHFLNM